LPSIIVHGGAGAYEPGEEHEEGLLAAVDAAWEVLSSGGRALDAVEAAIVAMEDAPVFNAGLGSSLNLEGVVECDASVMLSDYSCGAVASIEAAANPIRAARLVMERTDHVLLAGEGADAFAAKMGLSSRDLRTDRRIEIHRENLERFREGGEIKFMPNLEGIAEEMGIGTVGAAAIDVAGMLAAGTSTGGMMMKIPGRVGDGAIIGAGTYASPYGAVSATGHGESIVRHLIAKAAVDATRDIGVREAVENALEIGCAHGFGFGLVGVEETGAMAHGFTTQAMSWAERSEDGQHTFLDEDGSARRAGTLLDT
jgi:beta-aspartyl-peptidase (threonine type)